MGVWIVSKKGTSKAFYFCCCYFYSKEAITLAVSLAQENENRIVTKKCSELQWIVTGLLCRPFQWNNIKSIRKSKRYL